MRKKHVLNEWEQLKVFVFSSISADDFRPYLSSFQGNAFTDYINAVFVDVRANLCTEQFPPSYYLIGHRGVECCFCC